MYPDLQAPLPLSHHHYAAMALPPLPQPGLSPAPRAALALPIAEARLRSILMGV